MTFSPAFVMLDDLQVAITAVFACLVHSRPGLLHLRLLVHSGRAGQLVGRFLEHQAESLCAEQLTYQATTGRGAQNNDPASADGYGSLHDLLLTLGDEAGGSGDC